MVWFGMVCLEMDSNCNHFDRLVGLEGKWSYPLVECLLENYNA